MSAPQLEFVTGKGGVGKSAVAAAIARRRAGQGAKVLAITPSDPRGLGAHVGATVVDATPVVAGAENVHVALISPGLALQEYLRRHAGVSTPRIALAAKAFEALANTAPGVKEVITIGKVVAEAERGGWDSVVVDAPATGQFGAYLHAPATVLDLVKSGRVHDQAARLSESLSTARLSIVTLLEDLPGRESLQASAELAPTVGEVRMVANRVLEPIGDFDIDPGAARDALLLHRSMVDQQSHWRRRLSPSVELPYVFGSHPPDAIGRRLAESPL